MKVNELFEADTSVDAETVKQKIIDVILPMMMNDAKELYTIESSFDNDNISGRVYDAFEKHFKNLDSKVVDKVEKALKSKAVWEKAFKAKYGMSSEKMVAKLQKEEMAALPKNVRAFLEDLNEHLIAEITPTGIKTGMDQLRYYMKSNQRLIISAAGMSGVSYTAEALAEFGLDFEKVEKLFTSWGVKMGKRPAAPKRDAPIYD